MAKYRCPQCGAGHKDPPATCRLCGYVMDGTVDTVTPQKTAAPMKEKKGIGGMVLVGLGFVIGLGILAVVLGFTTGGLSYGRIRNKVGEWVPSLASKDDGWNQVADAEGGFTIDMPGEATADYVLYPPVENGRMVGWSAHIGTDTRLTVEYGKVIPVPGENAQATLNRLGDAWIYGTGEVDKRTDTTFQGYPALDYKIKNIPLFGKDASQRTIMFLKGQTLYVLQSQSIYSDNPSFPRFKDSMTFTT